MNRVDYAYPFRIDPASGQAAQTGYATHVDQMIRQVLLTAPGERADLPEFGCNHHDPGAAGAEPLAAD
jgi:phage baseplate assembly protein W